VRDRHGGQVSTAETVMTSPVEFPMYGKFKKTELSKENLLAFWDMVLNRLHWREWYPWMKYMKKMR
jgi:hypothetical protein